MFRKPYGLKARFAEDSFSATDSFPITVNFAADLPDDESLRLAMAMNHIICTLRQDLPGLLAGSAGSLRPDIYSDAIVLEGAALGGRAVSGRAAYLGAFDSYRRAVEAAAAVLRVRVAACNVQPTCLPGWLPQATSPSGGSSSGGGGGGGGGGGEITCTADLVLEWTGPPVPPLPGADALRAALGRPTPAAATQKRNQEDKRRGGGRICWQRP